MYDYGDYLSDLSLVGKVHSMHPAMMRLDRERRERERRRRYEDSPAKDFHSRMSYTYEKYNNTYLIMKNDMFIGYMEYKPNSYINNMDDEYYYYGVKLLAMIVKKKERGQGVGTKLLETMCKHSDCSGCTIELVANGFDVNIEDDDDPRRRIDMVNEYGIGFRDLRFTPKEQPTSRRLRKWYSRFGFRKAKPPPYADFQNDYFRRACMLRVPATAHPEYKKMMDVYCV